MNILMENTSIIYELFIQHLEEETNFYYEIQDYEKGIEYIQDLPS